MERTIFPIKQDAESEQPFIESKKDYIESYPASINRSIQSRFP